MWKVQIRTQHFNDLESYLPSTLSKCSLYKVTKFSPQMLSYFIRHSTSSISSFMSSISMASSSESDSTTAAAWKRKYEEQVEIVKTLGSSEQVRRYVHSPRTLHYYAI